MDTINMKVKAEYTPNPNSIKFVVDESIYPYGTLTYNSAAEAASVPVAERLFSVSGITKLFIMSNFVTVDKVDDVNWKDIHIEIKDIIKEDLDKFKTWAEQNKPESSASSDSDDEVRTKIETVLDKIRPALVADGGNIELVDVIGKDVRLRMVGACGTCPSALMTMKMGVERALTSELPDLVESVTQVF